MYQPTIGSTAALGRRFDIVFLITAPLLGNIWVCVSTKVVRPMCRFLQTLSLLACWLCSVRPEANAGHLADYNGTSLDVTPFPASLRPPCTATCNARPPLPIMMLRKAVAMYDRVVTHCLRGCCIWGPRTVESSHNHIPFLAFFLVYLALPATSWPVSLGCR